MINVFTDHIVPRLIYVLDFCFKQKGESYQLITSVDEWEKLSEKDLNYSTLNIKSKFQIKPQGILFESAIYQSKNIEFIEQSFKIDGVEDELGVIFYFLSRYEAYFSVHTDSHGRLVSAHNNFVKNKLNKTVVVDKIVKNIWLRLNLNYDQVLSQYEFIPTFDIDVAWAYKNRKFVRAVGAAIKGRKTVERFKVLTGLKKDPYDTYDLMREISVKSNGIVCFTLLGDWGRFDKNINWKNEEYGSLIRGLNLEGGIGIHPSYNSYLSQEKIQEEIGRLESITGHEIKKSRQHFLRLKIPESYLTLINSGITADYSMGFADNIGFRAGTSFPFYFFNLKENKASELLVHPFAYMDSALKDYLKVSPKVAIEYIAELIKEVKSVGGLFVFIWHNSSIHNKGEWKGWQDVLNFTVENGTKK